MMMKRLTFILFYLIVLIYSANASTYYVKPTGSDANSGLTEALAWQHVVKACTTLVADDTVLIRAGTYDETSWSNVTLPEGVTVQIGLTPQSQGSGVGNEIVFKGYPGDVRPLIVGMSNASPTSSNSRATVYLSNKHYIIYDSLEFRHGYQGIHIAAESHDIIVRNCIVDSTLSYVGETNNGGVLMMGGPSSDVYNRGMRNITIEGSTLFHNGCWSTGGGPTIYTAFNTSGIHNYYCDSCVFRNNTIYNQYHGISLKGSAKWTSIYRNVIHDVVEASMWTVWGGCSLCNGYNQSDARWYNNISYHSPVCITVAEGSSAVENQNDSLIYFYNNTCDCSNGGALGSGTGAGVVSRKGCFNSSFFFNNIFYNPAFALNGCWYPDRRASVAICADTRFPIDFYEDYNLSWGRGTSGDYYAWPLTVGANPTAYTLTEWRAASPTGVVAGQGTHSVVADPEFVDVANHDYTLATGSPALTGGKGGSFTFYPGTYREETVTLPTYFGALGEEDPCAVTHSLSSASVGRDSAIAIDNYSYDTDSTLSKLKLVWDDDGNIIDPLGADSITAGFTDPDSLTITGLTSATQYWYWWILYNGGCDPDTSIAGTFATAAGVAHLMIRK